MPAAQNLRALPSNLQPISPASIFTFGADARINMAAQANPGQQLPIQPPVAAPPQHPQSQAPSNGAGAAVASTSESSPAPSGSESGESDEESEENDTAADAWLPITEDQTRPCTDELAFIESRKEHNAHEHEYWQKKFFLDLDDPEFIPGATGRIDWLIDPFNGTKEAPNTTELLLSPIVSIGGYEWRLRFFPRGDSTDFLSVYLECVTMSRPDFAEFEDFDSPAFPLMRKLHEQRNALIRKRRSIAVQFGVVMYNPGEPRVHEYKTDAHQFNKQSADFGFRYFSGDTRYEFHRRKHGQRVPILQNDKLAFSCYIRIVDDPTGHLWQHTSGYGLYDECVLTTGLRPFSNMGALMPAATALIHFTPFRDFLRTCRRSSRQVHALQHWLLKFYSRLCSPSYGQPKDLPSNDAVSILSDIARELRRECGDEKITELIGSVDPNTGAAVGSNRLKTKSRLSIQDAVNSHSPIETPQLLTLELERQEFDRSTRKWKRLTNHVRLDNHLYVGNKRYILYAFGTQTGELGSKQHKAYVRPGGPDKLWYAYEDGRVVATTNKQALESGSGTQSRADGPRRDSPFTGASNLEQEREIAYIVMYVREDVSDRTFDRPRYEYWKPPDAIRKLQDYAPGFEYEKTPDETTTPTPGQSNFMAKPQDGAQDGSATPPWPMDGEDVLMSDPEDSQEPENLANSAYLTSATTRTSASLKMVTIDGFGRDYYHGQMQNGQRHGHGHLIRLNGDEYKGEFKEGLPHGHGRMVYASNGDIYEGQWKDGEHHGQGDYTELSTKNTYSGGWRDGRKHGDFVLRGTVTEEDRGYCTICYENQITTAFYDCGHVVSCKDCANLVDNCPVCRKRVIARLQLYGVKMTLE